MCPAAIAMSESKDRVSVRANVAGFEPDEIEVSVEPGRITIMDSKKESTGKMRNRGRARGVVRIPIRFWK